VRNCNPTDQPKKTIRRAVAAAHHAVTRGSWRIRTAVVLATATAAGLTWVPSSPADTSYTWAGAGTAASAQNWTNTDNWGGTPPTAGSTVGTLSFPLLPGCPQAATCYEGTDDLGGNITAAQLSIDDAQPYRLIPNPSDPADIDTLTLDPAGSSPGLFAMPTEPVAGSPDISIPVELGDNQTWEIEGGFANSALTVSQVIDSSAYTLDLRLFGGNLDATTLGTGTLTLDGSGILEMTPGSDGSHAVLPAAQIKLDNGPSLYVESPGVSSGPIDASAAASGGNVLRVGDGALPESTLTVNGDLALGQSTSLGFFIDGTDSTPAVESSEMTVNGNVMLNGARLGVSQGYVDSSSHDCVDIPPGTTYELLATSGTISGDLHYSDGTSFGNSVSEGQASAEPMPFGQDCAGTPGAAYINYGAHSITATIASGPSSTQAPTIGGTAQVGQTLSVTSGGGWAAYPAPTYTYEWFSCSADGCVPISGAVDPTYQLTSAQQGDTIMAAVIATNPMGVTGAESNVLGPVTAEPASTSAKLPSTARVLAALDGVGHPSGTRAIAALIRSRGFKTGLNALSAGTLSVVWTTEVTTGTGRHRRRRKVTVASGSAHTSAADRLTITIHLTAAGLSLLRAKPYGRRVRATEKFQPTGGRAVTATRRFTL
jgi:hypothetical protein